MTPFLYVSSGTCTYVNDPANQPTYSFPPGTGGAYVSYTCADTLVPGQQIGGTYTVGLGTSAAGTPIAIDSAVDPNNLIQEIAETNNTYHAVVPAP